MTTCNPFDLSSVAGYLNLNNDAVYMQRHVGASQLSVVMITIRVTTVRTGERSD